MKIRFLKLKDWLLMSLMGVMGMTACHSSKEVAQQTADPEPEKEVVNPREEMALMYGVPTMDYVLKGRVIDTEGKGVRGMQVILVNTRVDLSPEEMYEDNPYVQEYIKGASDTTDAEGYFQCHMQDVPTDVHHVIVRDIDGQKNGAFVDQMVPVNFAEGEQTGDRKGWYLGTRTKDVDITVMKTSEKE
jgi:putative lipoprotein (rSAM/lipoprotein system)